MMECWPGATQAGTIQCVMGEPGSPATYVTDQFGNVGQDPYGRMLGPRYPHSWGVTCLAYDAFWDAYIVGNAPSIPIMGSVGAVGTLATRSGR